MNGLLKWVLIIGGIILVIAVIILGITFFSSRESSQEQSPSGSSSSDSGQLPEGGNQRGAGSDEVQPRTPPLPLEESQRERILTQEFQEIFETEFQGRNFFIEDVSQVDSYVAVDWSDENAGGISFWIFTSDGWKILDIGGGFPYPEDLLNEYGIPIETSEELLDDIFPEWRDFIE